MVELKIKVTDEQALELEQKAKLAGIPFEQWLQQLVEKEAPAPENRRRPLKSGLGLLAPYGPALSAEEIDENRAEMFGGLAEKHR